MSDLLLGFLSGSLVMLILNTWMHHNYRKILVMCAEQGTPERINGKFYYIKEEGK